MVNQTCGDWPLARKSTQRLGWKLIGAILGCLVLALPAMGQSIESVMREIQVRKQLVQGNLPPIAWGWGTCESCADVAPPFPPDGFFDCVVAESCETDDCLACKAALVQQLVNAFLFADTWIELYLNPETVDLEGHDEGDDAVNFDEFTDFPEVLAYTSGYDPGAVTPCNYQSALAAVQSALGRVHYVRLGAGWANTQGRGADINTPEHIPVTVTLCPGLFGEFVVCAETAWGEGWQTATSQAPRVFDGCGDIPLDDPIDFSYLYGPFCPDADAHYGAVSPEAGYEFNGLGAWAIRSDLVISGGMPRLMGSAKVYISGHPGADGAGHGPPVVLDGKYHLFAGYNGSLSDEHTVAHRVGDPGAMPSLSYGGCGDHDPGWEIGWYASDGGYGPRCIVDVWFEEPNSCHVCNLETNLDEDSRNGPTGDPAETNTVECNGDGAGEANEAAHTVHVSDGSKVERVVDVSVPVTGPDFELVREYTSRESYLEDGSNLLGMGWTTSAFDHLSPGEIQDGVPRTLALVGVPMTRTMVFEQDENDPHRWVLPLGPSRQYIIDGDQAGQLGLVINGVVWPVYRLIDPGVSERDFICSPHGDWGDDPCEKVPEEGLWYLLLQERDLYSNFRTYDYMLFGNGAPDDKIARLCTIYLNGTPPDAGLPEGCDGNDEPVVPEAVVNFFWHLVDADAGMLDHIEVHRGGTLTDRVDYVRGRAVGDMSPDVGTDTDLVQVTNQQLVGLTWKTITQYRYHNDDSGGGEERFGVGGAAHQLKMVIEPQQVEYYAQKRAEEENGGWNVNEALDLAAAEILAADDGAVPGAWPGDDIVVADLAAKIVGYGLVGTESRVIVQYLQAGGCCGASPDGAKIEYNYWDYNSGLGLSASLEETGLDGVGDYSIPHRTTYYNMERLGGAGTAPYMINKAIKEPSPGNRVWVTHYAYNTDTHTLAAEYTPATISTYSPGSQGTAPSISYNSTGLVHSYAYTATKRLWKSFVRTAPNGSDLLVEQTTYGDNSPTPDWLPVQVDRYRTTSNPGAGDIETVNYEYIMRGTTSVGVVRTIVETEPESENGPGGQDLPVYDSYEVYDERGRLRWSIAPDQSLTFTDYDILGEVAKIIRNANMIESYKYALWPLDDMMVELGEEALPGWGAETPEGQLVTTYQHDQAGRVTMITAPGDIKTFVNRDMLAFPADDERPGLLYWAETSLSGGGTTARGPATTTWRDAAGSTIATCGFAVTDFAGGSWDAEPLSRETVQNSLSGEVISRRAWHRLADDVFYETDFTYDSFGRLVTQTSPTGTITENAQFDALDRVLEIKVGTAGHMTTVSKHYFDHTMSMGQPVQGQGNGNETFTRQFTADNGTLAADQRDTIRTFDARDRLITVQTPEAPYEFIVYDNLDRITERALFNGTNGVPSAINVPLTDRGLYTKLLYNQRGLLYKQKVSIVPNVATPEVFLETNNWFDSVGRTIAVWAPNSPGVKRVYDHLGRVTASYTTDRDDDAAPGASGNYTDAASVDDDRAVEQVEYSYDIEDGAHLLQIVSSTRRLHDTSATGPLVATGGTPTGVASYVATYYDEAQRPVRTVDFGTHTGDDLYEVGGTLPEWPPDDLPEWDDTDYNGGKAIVTGVESFNARGLVDVSLDSGGKLTKFFYDDLGRRIAVAENYEDADVSWDDSAGRWVASGVESGELDKDRVTSFVLDGSGNVVKQVAHLPPTGGGVDVDDAQITEYVLGVTAGSPGTKTDSLIYSNDLVKEVRYPDETTGNPGSTDAYKVKYAYNAQAELRSVKDQNGTEHDFTRDLTGRTTADTVSAFGTGIDNRVKRVNMTFDGLGRLTDSVSYSDVNASTSVNGVKLTYTSLWQVNKVFQDYDSAVTLSGGNPSGNTRVLTYSYSTSVPSGGSSASNYSRVTNMQLPYTSNQQFIYGSSASLDDRVHRVESLKVQRGSGAAAEFVSYDYVGLDMAALVNYPLVGLPSTTGRPLSLDRTVAHNGARVSGEYPGWDRFGRVILHSWVDADLTTHATNNTLPNKPPLFQESYSYDAAGNKLTRFDARPGASWTHRDFAFSYDDLDRLAQADRGASPGGWTPGVGGQKWALDLLGNWTTFKTDINGNGTYGDVAAETDTRAHNQANELSSRYSGGTNLTYDDAGNMKTYGSRTFTHDAWNRLVKVTQQVGTPVYTIGEYEYNGLNWRTLKRCDTSTTYNGLDQLRVLYYDAAWQLVEEWIDNSYISSSGFNDVAENYWGVRYIDDLVMRRIDDDSDGSFRRFLLITDSQFSVVASMSSSQDLIDRVAYDSYGTARHHRLADVDGDGDSDSTDSGIITSLHGKGIADTGYRVEADLDRNGTINTTDDTYWSSRSALPAGWISGAGEADCPIGYDGYVFNPETNLYSVRLRWYDSLLGRWMQADLIDYIDGMSRFAYVRSAPMHFADPTGLMSLQHYRCDDGDEDSLGTIILKILLSPLSMGGCARQPVPAPPSTLTPAPCKEGKEHVDDYWERWKKENPGYSDEQYKRMRETLDRGCIGVTCLNVGEEGNPDLSDCYDTYDAAKESQKEKDKSCACGTGKPVVFSMRFWSNPGHDTDDPKAFTPGPDHKVDMTPYVSGPRPWRRPGMVNFDYGWPSCPEKGLWTHANHAHNKPDAMYVYTDIWDPNSDFDRQVYCVTCTKNDFNTPPKP